VLWIADEVEAPTPEPVVKTAKTKKTKSRAVKGTHPAGKRTRTKARAHRRG
jgi:hypothetical protein